MSRSPHHTGTAGKKNPTTDFFFFFFFTNFQGCDFSDKMLAGTKAEFLPTHRQGLYLMHISELPQADMKSAAESRGPPQTQATFLSSFGKPTHLFGTWGL